MNRDSVETYVSLHHGLLGTVIELRLQATTEDDADHAKELIISEIARLEQVFNVYDDESQLRRWQHGNTVPGRELSEVLGLALTWQRRSGGAFNPAVGHLTELWSAAAARGESPTRGAIVAAVSSINEPPYRIDNGELTVTGGIQTVDLNAIAKGWIVDHAAAAALNRTDTMGLTVNAGGDLLHRGSEPLVVGIEDPDRPYDNVPPLFRIELHDGALATSGGSRRGWEIAGDWFSHVLDPRTGHPVDHVASASVMAGDAATADVVATILTVLAPEEGLVFVDTLGGVGCCLVRRDGAITANQAWLANQIS